MQTDTTPASPVKRQLDRLIVHCGYHKCLTVFFDRVLKAAAAELGLRYQNSIREPMLATDTDIFLDQHSRLDLAALPKYVGTHVIRDPRDLVISAYFYHLRCQERWCRDERQQIYRRLPWYRTTYQRHLRRLPQVLGIHYEMRHSAANAIRGMARWDYANPNMLELRYEQIIGHEVQTFERIFRWYGFSEAQIEKLLPIVDRFSLKNIQQSDDPGDAGVREHAKQGGEPGKWREHFTRWHKQQFKRQFPGLLRKLGYEADDNW